MQVAKWGNSLAVRLPARIVEVLKLRAGDEVEIHVAADRAFAVAKRASVRELLDRVRQHRGQLPKDFRFDRLDANERG
jgi:antitoxin MazE